MGKHQALISAIGAVSRNGVLGLDNWLPWDIPEELAYFEQTVAGAALVIGRLTYESMVAVPEDSFVVSRQASLPMRPGCTHVPTVEEGLRAAVATGKPVFVIGGASVYAAAWPYCQRFYLTRIDQDYSGDTLFPSDIPLAQWPLVGRDERMMLDRKTGKLVKCIFMQYEQPVGLVLPLP